MGNFMKCINAIEVTKITQDYKLVLEDEILLHKMWSEPSAQFAQQPILTFIQNWLASSNICNIQVKLSVAHIYETVNSTLMKLIDKSSFNYFFYYPFTNVSWYFFVVFICFFLVM